MVKIFKKFKGFNILRKLQREKLGFGKLKPWDRITDWKIRQGDTVEVIRDDYNPDNIGKRGKVMTVLKKNNRVVVEGVNRHIKLLRPNWDNLKGGKITKERSIPYENIRLVDPVTNSPCDVEFITVYDPTESRNVRKRISKATNHTIPLPPNTQYPEKSGALDTPADIVKQVTFTPSLLTAPFPNSLLNEMYRLKRHWKEPRAI